MATLDEKYPNAYFDYLLSMLSKSKDIWIETDFRNLLDEFRDMEGEQLFMNLQNELKQIIANQDLETYALRAQEYHRKKINLTEIQVLSNMILE